MKPSHFKETLSIYILSIRKQPSRLAMEKPSPSGEGLGLPAGALATARQAGEVKEQHDPIRTHHP